MTGRSTAAAAWAGRRRCGGVGAALCSGVVGGLLCGLAAGLAGCDAGPPRPGSAPTATNATQPAPPATAHASASAALVAAAPTRSTTVQELMTTLVDPSADALWEAVSTEITAAGTVERRPQTDEDWATLRQYALRLIDGAGLLAEPGRPVAAPGRAVEDAHVAGILQASEIQAVIERNPQGFTAAARVLQDSARQMLASIDAHDATRLVRVGQGLDQACERCHSVYWYPGDKRPGAAVWPAPFDTRRASADRSPARAGA